MPTQLLELKVTADVDGEMMIGVTTDPEEFMNRKQSDDIEFYDAESGHHEVFRTNHWIKMSNGGLNAFGGPLIEGLTMDIWIGSIEHFSDRDNCVQIYKVAENNRILRKGDRNRDMLGYLLRDDENGNVMDYYLAIAWTATNKKIVRFEISSEFV